MVTTNLKTHYCGTIPRLALIERSKNKSKFGSDFKLILIKNFVEGKLEPKTYEISVDIAFCPFCGEKIEAKPHLESCKCDLCDFSKTIRDIGFDEDELFK